jgi:hypothetical protein
LLGPAFFARGSGDEPRVGPLEPGSDAEQPWVGDRVRIS